MTLLDRAGLLLKSGETVVKAGKCKGKVPGETTQKMTGGFSVRIAETVGWQDVDGELVLTNLRLIVVGERGRVRKEVVPFMDLDLGRVTAVSTAKGLTGGEKLILSLDLGTGKPEKTEFGVEGSATWASSIRDQIGQASQRVEQAQPVIPQAQYCTNCGGSIPVGSKFCSNCGAAQT